MNFRSFILLLVTFLFAAIGTTEGNTRHVHAPGKLVLEMLQEEQDARDCFEECVIVFSEINAQRPGRIRSRFTASSSFFIISSVTRAEEDSLKDVFVVNNYRTYQDAHPQPFYYQFLFRLTPF